MTTDEAIITTEAVDDRRRKAALLRAIGLDKVPPEQRDLAIAIATRYDLDLMLKHLVLVDGRPYVTRDGLLWIAHRSGVLDGIEVTEPVVKNIPGLGEFWYATASVWRKDMSRPFTFSGRYPTKGGNARFAPEMAVKTAESMSLRRAFNVSAATIDERFDLADVQANVDAVSVPQQPPRSLAERVQERRPVGPPISSRPAGPSPDEDDETVQAMGARRLQEAEEPTLDDVLPECGDEGALGLGTCDELPGHRGPHRSPKGQWPVR